MTCRRETILEAHLSNGHTPNGREQPGQTAAEAAAAEAASLREAAATDVESLAPSLYLDLRPFMDQAPPSVRYLPPPPPPSPSYPHSCPQLLRPQTLNPKP